MSMLSNKEGQSPEASPVKTSKLLYSKIKIQIKTRKLIKK